MGLLVNKAKGDGSPGASRAMVGVTGMSNGWARRFTRDGWLAVPVILLFALMVGCAAQNPATVSHPGAINQFDSNAYDTLVTAQGAIDAARPLASTDAQKAILNKAIAAYNTAKNAYLLYHSQVAAGGNVDTSTLQAQLTALITSTANLTQQIQGAK